MRKMPGITTNGSSRKPDDARRIPITIEERRDGCYSISHLQMALEGLHQDGMVILKDLVNIDHCDKLYEHMAGDRDRIVKERHPGAKVYNQGVKCELTVCNETDIVRARCPD